MKQKQKRGKFTKIEILKFVILKLTKSCFSFRLRAKYRDSTDVKIKKKTLKNIFRKDGKIFSKPFK